jgi:hypothetical protein
MEKEFDLVYWNKLKSKLKQEYPLLTNADLLWRNNTKEELLRTIALKLGKTRREMLEIIDMD